LVTIPAAGVMSGVTTHTVLLISSAAKPEVWQERLKFPGPVLTMPAAAEVAGLLELRFIGAACTGAGARLVGVIPREALARAIREELAPLGEAVVAKDLEVALEAYDRMAEHAGCVTAGKDPPADAYEKPLWIDLPFEDANISAPIIHAPATSELVPTGLWRTMRPIIDYDHCKRCAWICSTLCPDSTISINAEGYPVIDYQHCKGCLICMTSCPSHAIRAIPEQEAAAEMTGGARS
jgi:pyruvate ferredoxin oxidoreductase gamma subunit